MSFIPEETSKEAELRKRVEASFEKDPDAPKSLKSKETRKSETSKEKSERSRKDYEQKQKTLEYKRERLEWQKERSKLKDKLRRETEARRKKRESSVEIKPAETIGEKDRDPTAYKKAIGGVASFAKGVAKVGMKAVIGAAKKRRREREDQIGDVKRKASSREKVKQRLDTQLKQKLLPGTKIKGALKSKNVKGLLPSSTVGQTARKDPEFKRREIEKRGGTVSEEFSYWREEFLYELGTLRKNSKKSKKDEDDYIVDVMSKNAKNLVTIGPSVKENYIFEEKNKFSYSLVQTILKKLIDEKKRKNYLLNIGTIGESKYDKSGLKCNSPKSDPVGSGETGKSHVVKACKGGTEKLIRFGQRGVKGSPKKEGESEAYRNRRKRFKARHAKNIAKGKMSAAYWSSVVKW